jgi:hypothetical protein
VVEPIGETEQQNMILEKVFVELGAGVVLVAA